MFRKLSISALAALALSGTAIAANPYGPGWEVVDTQGQKVGIVVAIDGDTGLIIRTDKHDVKFPVTSVTKSNGKLLVALDQAGLNAKFDADSSLAVGKPVKGTGGTELGTIDQIDDQYVTLKLTSGQTVKLPRNGIVGNATGAVAGISLDQLQAQLSGSAATTAAAPSNSSSQ